MKEKGSDASANACRETSSRLWPLDALRGLTAIMIVIVHYTTTSWSFESPVIQLPFPAPMNELTSFVFAELFGRVGVVFFFSLSGFVFMRNYRESISEHSVKLSEFCIGRFSRLYPLAWLTSLLILLIEVIFYNLEDGGFLYSPYDLIKSFTLWGMYVLDTGTPILNGPAWTLSMEISMYMLFFFITYSSKKSEFPIIRYIVPLVIGILIANLDAVNLPIFNPNFALTLISFFPAA